jgi:hypothetical protein
MTVLSSNVGNAGIAGVVPRLDARRLMSDETMEFYDYAAELLLESKREDWDES